MELLDEDLQETSDKLLLFHSSSQVLYLHPKCCDVIHTHTADIPNLHAG